MAQERVTPKTIFLGRVQADLSTRVTDLAVGTDALRVTKASSLEIVPEMLPADSHSAEMPFEELAVGGVQATATLEALIRPPGTLSDPPVQAELPREFDALTRSSGFTRVIPASGQWVTWYYTNSLEEALTLEKYNLARKASGAQSKMNRTAAWNLGFDWVFAFVPKQFLKLTCTGMGRPKDPDVLVEDGGTWGGTITYQGGKPMISKGATHTLADTSDDSVYGGGTLASPDYKVCILDLKVQGNRGIAPLDCDAADGGVQGVSSENAAPTGTIVLEAQHVDDYDPHAMLLSQTPLELRYSWPVPGVAGLRLWWVDYIRITKVAPITFNNGRGLYSIEFASTAPADASDGSPAAGTDPGQRFTSGTNKGLPNSDGANAPFGARGAFQLVQS